MSMKKNDLELIDIFDYEKSCKNARIDDDSY